MTTQDSGSAKRYIKLLGLLAVGGISIGVVADVFSGWSNDPNAMTTAVSLSLEDVKGLFINKPRWEFIVGNYLAIFFLPFHIVGSYLVYLTLRPASKKLAMVYFLPAAYLAVLGAGYHGTYAFVGDIIQSGDEVLMNNMLDYWFYWGAILVVGYSIMSIYLFALILQGRSIFPKWAAIISPISIVFFTTLITLALPENMIGIKVFLTVTGLNLPLAIFYFVATKYLLRERNVELSFP
jgi:Family of unknown function (DUF6796)